LLTGSLDGEPGAIAAVPPLRRLAPRDEVWAASPNADVVVCFGRGGLVCP